MLLELIGFVGAIIILLFFFAEQRKPALGLFGSIMLMVLSFWILSDGIQIRTGELTSISAAANTSESSAGNLAGTSTLDGNTTDYSETYGQNTTGLTNTTGTETIDYVYSNVPATPYAETPWFVGIMLLLLSLYGMFHYIFILIRG